MMIKEVAAVTTVGSTMDRNSGSFALTKVGSWLLSCEVQGVTVGRKPPLFNNKCVGKPTGQSARLPWSIFFVTFVYYVAGSGRER